MSLQLTFFCAVMCIDMRRQEARRMDVVCWVTSSAPVDQGWCRGAFGQGKPSDRISTLAMRLLGRQIAKPFFRGLILALWFVALVVGIYEASQMRITADRIDMLPYDSYLRDFDAVQKLYFGNAGSDLGLYWVSEDEVCTACDVSPKHHDWVISNEITSRRLRLSELKLLQGLIA
jgi:hypothetical protein